MKKISLKFNSFELKLKTILFVVVALTQFTLNAQVTLEEEVKITDLAMYFNGNRVPISHTENSTTGHDYVYGRTLTPHGDCIKTYKQYVFMSWYRGGKSDRHVMLTRYNTETGTMKTIEFPHRHTGFKGKWWIGETHNTIAVGISPINGTVHMVYDMHAYTNSGIFSNDYFRYSYSVENAAELPDADFTLDKFVKDPLDGDYKHTTMDGVRNPTKYDRFTYPQFFLNDDGELFLTARDGTSHDGAQAFIKYDAATEKWGDFYYFNALGAKNKGETHDWSIYGSMKYVDGKIRIGFQRRLNTGSDKYNAQNGVYYAYSNDPTGATQWKNHEGESITFPIVKAEETLVFEPGDLVETQERNQVHIVSGFDWTVTDNGDVHIISRVADRENNITKNIHSYKPNGSNDFIISTDFEKASNIYTSGNDIFVIGLNSLGRPFVDRAVGGTNDFTRVYEQTSGKRFNKGQVHISNGKLYYYLLEIKPNNNEDVRTTFLQVIDLSALDQPDVFGINLLTPSNNQSVDEGKEVQLFALASADEGDEITKVAFMINNELYQEVTEAPYRLDWTPEASGSYTIQAIAYDNNNQNIASETRSITVVEVDPTDLTRDTYRIQNVATGEFLRDAGSSATPTTMSPSAETDNTHWNFVESGNYYNIDSQNFGILRFVGANFSGGANAVVSTSKSPPAADNDKVWTLHHNETDDTYRFEAKENGRYLYLAESGNVINTEAEATDDRSKWRVISASQVLSVTDQELDQSSSVAIYPNPADAKFTIAFKNTTAIKAVAIYNILGEIVFQKTTNSNVLEVDSRAFKTGIYLVKSIAADDKSIYSKLVIK